MAQPIFPAAVVYNIDRGSMVEEYIPSQVVAEQFLAGDFVKLVANVAKVCAADPVSILGISEVGSEKARVITVNGKVPIRVLNQESVLLMSSITVPVEATHLQQQYGITKDATTGFWQVDTSKTGAVVRIQVIRLDVAAGLWFVKPIALNLANTTIIS